MLSLFVRILGALHSITKTKIHVLNKCLITKNLNWVK